MYSSPFLLLILYICSLPLANDNTFLGVESSPINKSPICIFSTNSTFPLYNITLVPFPKHFPNPHGNSSSPPPPSPMWSKYLFTTGT